MNITVIGRGNIGGGPADPWERAGHQVTRLGRAGGEAQRLVRQLSLDAGYDALRLGDLNMAATQEGMAGPTFAIAQSGPGRFVYRMASPEQI
ncbi:hypothetical protein ACFWMG_36655 [Streptomyces sp. NPDC127074]|uniref:hypothetical protein n=1 Tax=Streptomyces sp. NPDC127074 TaxID=3347130 RepID=UPI003663DA25